MHPGYGFLSEREAFATALANAGTPLYEIGTVLGHRQLAFQRAAEWVPPRWPDPASSMQAHLDFDVDDADAADFIQTRRRRSA